MKKIILATVLCISLSLSQAAQAQLFVSFFDADNANDGNITVLTPFSSENKCFNVAMSLVEDGLTDVFDMSSEEADIALSEAEIKPGVYAFRFSDGAKKKDKKLTFSSSKKGLERNNNKGKNKTVFAFRVKKSKGDGALSISKRSEKIVCITDTALEAGSEIPVSFSSFSRKAVKQFGLQSTIFSLPVAAASQE